jgi:DNA-binding beta-propeller fold protein YncE
VVATIAVPGLMVPKSLVLAPNSDMLYVVGRDSNDVHGIDTSILSQTVVYAVGAQPFGSVVLNDVLYVANFADGTISRIDLHTGLSVLPDIMVGHEPTWLDADPLTGRLWVPLHRGGAVDVIVYSSVWSKIATGPGPFAVVVDAARRVAYVGNRDDKSVTTIDADSGGRIRTFGADGSPFAMAINESTGHLYVLHGPPGGDCPVNHLAIFDTDGILLRDVAVGNSCDGGWVAVNQANGRVYVAATEDNELWILDGNANLRHVLTVADGIGHAPFGLAIDAATSRIYVGNKLDNTISVVHDP